MSAPSVPFSNAWMVRRSKTSSIAPIVGSPIEWLSPPVVRTTTRRFSGYDATARAMSLPQATQRRSEGIGNSRLLITIGMIRGSLASSMRKSGMQKP